MVTRLKYCVDMGLCDFAKLYVLLARVATVECNPSCNPL